MVEYVTLDYWVLGLFFVILAGTVLVAMLQKERDTTDYFLAGRSVGWLVIG